jgi:hypothetical protein
MNAASDSRSLNPTCGRRPFLAAALSAASLPFAPLRLLANSVADDPAATRHWLAGTARAVITPTTPVWLAGYGTSRPPDGKLHDLWLKALALAPQSASQTPVVLLTSDFQGVPKSMSDRVFARLQSELGLSRASVMFTFSHNHCGPRLGDDLFDYYPRDAEQELLVDQYTSAMVELTVNVVRQSLQKMTPVKLESFRGSASFAVNRRNNPEAEVPRMLSAGEPLRGPVDHDVPVLRVSPLNLESPATEAPPIALLFGYACHPTTLSFNTWCGDYPGFAQLNLEAAIPGCQAMFVNTCGGDQNPLPRRTVELCRSYGQALSDAVLAALQTPGSPITPQLQTAFTTIDLPYLSVVSRDELLSLTADANPIRARWATRMLSKLAQGDTFESAYPYPLHMWLLGNDTRMIGMGAETVVDYALRFKATYGRQTWVCGYTDDMISYIPSRRVWEEGGYEGGSNLFEYGRPAFRWSGDIEDRIVAAVQQLLPPEDDRLR